jgi:hypothetical protein
MILWLALFAAVAVAFAIPCLAFGHLVRFLFRRITRRR